MRRTTRVTITEEGRDKGKVFILTELPADQAERWAIRAMLGMIQSGSEISPDSLQGGMASLAILGVHALGGIEWSTLEPLLDEMWTCVQYLHKPGNPPQEIQPGVNSQIEEVQTRLALRVAVLDLHLGFYIADASPTLGQASNGDETSATPTFPTRLHTWYRRILRR
jgi:hypothetical protein